MPALGLRIEEVQRPPTIALTIPEDVRVVPFAPLEVNTIKDLRLSSGLRHLLTRCWRSVPPPQGFQRCWHFVYAYPRWSNPLLLLKIWDTFRSTPTTRLSLKSIPAQLIWGINWSCLRHVYSLLPTYLLADGLRRVKAENPVVVEILAEFFWGYGFVIALGFGCLWRSLRLFDLVLLSFLLALAWVRLLNQFPHQVIWFHPPAFACSNKHLVMDIWDLDYLCHVRLKPGSTLISDGGYTTLWLPFCAEHFGQYLIASSVHIQ